MNKPDIESLRNQLHMLERAVRAVRANLEVLSVGTPATSAQAPGVIDCPLTALLNRPPSIDRRSVAPYDAFVPGACVAFPPRSDVITMMAEARGFTAPNVGTDAGSSCLMLRLQRKASPGPAWATLETEIAPAMIAPLSSLQVRIILSFQSRHWRPLGSYRVFLRLFFEKEHKDYYPKTFPALEVPIEGTYRITEEEFAVLPRLGVREARIIIGLPMLDEADYMAILSFFEVAGS
jgi:hypothetical protein